ncbi:MAG TPA: DUF350 domain-containing protein [Devosiaceae bacterium]|jgi:hypothetical protein
MAHLEPGRIYRRPYRLTGLIHRGNSHNVAMLMAAAGAALAIILAAAGVMSVLF